MSEMEKKEYAVEMKFEDEDVCMMPFVEGMVKDVILGLVRNLKGFEEGQEVNIRLKVK